MAVSLPLMPSVHKLYFAISKIIKIGWQMGLLDGAARLIKDRPSIIGGAPGCYKEFNLIEIPDVMKKAGRMVGAQLMNRWFANPAYTIPLDFKLGKFPHARLPGLQIDTSIVNMSWVLRFDRARAIFKELKSGMYQNNSESYRKSKNELFDSLKKAGKFQPYKTIFGEVNAKPNTIDVHESAHLNFRKAGTEILEKAFDPLDDLYCGLGAFAAHMAASGSVTPIKGGKSGRATHQVTIEKLGYYIRDVYDFNEDQPLGFWGPDKFSKFPGEGLFAVDNAVFRDWRAKHGRGGDFIIFSDILWEQAPKNLVWEYPY